MADVAAFVREARHEADLSMRALAQRSDVSFTTIYRIENRELDPRLTTIEKLLSAMGQELRLSRSPAEPVPCLAELTDAWSTDAAGRQEPDWTRLRAFTDYLFRHPEAAGASIRATPPASDTPVLDNHLAAIAEKIADDAHLHRPAWTKRVTPLSVAWEGLGTARMRAAARASTLPQFAARNVFVPADTLWRPRHHAPT